MKKAKSLKHPVRMFRSIGTGVGKKIFFWGSKILEFFFCRYEQF